MISNNVAFSDCAYAQADLNLCWSHIPLCRKSHVAAHFHFSSSESLVESLIYSWRVMVQFVFTLKTITNMQILQAITNMQRRKTSNLTKNRREFPRLLLDEKEPEHICMQKPLRNTVKPVLSGHSKIDKTKILMTNGSLMKVESIAECSPWSILQYF